MSATSKMTLGVAGVVCIGLFSYVSGKQWWDKKKMSETTLKDIQRQESRKIENLYWFNKQLEMRNIMKRYKEEDEEISMEILKSTEKDEM